MNSAIHLPKHGVEYRQAVINRRTGRGLAGYKESSQSLKSYALIVCKFYSVDDWLVFVSIKPINFFSVGVNGLHVS